MDNSAVIWIVIFAVAAIGFYLVAAVVAVKGFSDLRLLLRRSDRNHEFEANAAEEKISD